MNTDWTLTLKATAQNPQVIIEALHDMLQYIDAVISQFSTSGYMKEEDGPLFATLQDLSGEDHNATLILTETRAPDSLAHPIYDEIVRSRDYIIGTKVRDIQTGRHYQVRASIWYNISQEWYYILFDEDDVDAPFETLASSRLLSDQVFQAMRRQLCKITGEKDWTWNPLINMWTRGHHGSRRVRITDVFTIIKDAQDAKTVPF